MSIAMQGTWTVRVIGRSAAWDQRVRVVHANGSSTYHPGDTLAPAFTVTDPTWGIIVEHDDGSGEWRANADRITFPAVSGGLYRFEIASDDGGGTDADFNDLVLECTTAVTASDFLVYGHLSTWSGRCWYNPCRRLELVIETVEGLRDALKDKAARAALEKLYPERVAALRLAEPDPDTFRPLLLPVTERSALPPRRALIATPSEGGLLRRVVPFDLRPELPALQPALAIDLGRILDRPFPFPLCRTESLGGWVLRFQEYDRSPSELAGGAWTGDGPREDLGTTAADAFGNYLFRFSRSLGAAASEALVDVAIGEDATVQAMPDVIAQLLYSASAGGVAHETAPYFNVPNLRRIDICIPKSRLPGPSACQGGLAMQFIGAIPTIRTSPGQPAGFTAQGRVSTPVDAATASPDGLQCAAWGSTLEIRGCFLDHADATWYTVRYRAGSSGPWTFYADEQKRQPAPALGIIPLRIGPDYPTLAVPDSGSASPIVAPAYQVTDGDDAEWAFSEQALKARLHTFVPGFPQGEVQIRMDAYNGSGAPLVSDTLTVFVDNSAPDYDVRGITLAGHPVDLDPTTCTLLTLTQPELSMPMEVEYRARDLMGQLASYTLSVSRCNAGVSDPMVTVSYPGPTASGCDASPFHGTGAVGDGYTTSTISPATPWIAADETFNILSVSVGVAKRVTNGAVAQVYSYSNRSVVFGIRR